MQSFKTYVADRILGGLASLSLRGLLGLGLIGAGSVGCGSHVPTDYSVVAPARDWSAFPAVVDVPAVTDLYAVSDPHGGYQRLATLLAASRLIAGVPMSPGSVVWSGGNAVLVVSGDLIDKGPQSLEVIDFLIGLEKSASAMGGQLIVLLGNHEAEFFVDPNNSKATGTDGVDPELQSLSIDPVAVASGVEPRGAWLRNRAFAARVGAWFFAHAGDTHGHTVAELESALRTALDTQRNFSDPLFVGTDSLLESRNWYSDTQVAPRYLAALGARHIVFGHDPGAIGSNGSVGVAQSGQLFRIDCGMSPTVNYSTGKLLHVQRAGVIDIATEINAGGVAKEIWRGP
jgi:hypothetical protein